LSSRDVSRPSFEAVQRLFSSAGLGSPEDIEPLAGGENSQVFEVRCTEPDRALVLKVYSDDLRWKMATEVFVFGLLERTPLPTPRVLAADDSGSLMDEAFLVMTKLPGTLLGSIALIEDDVERVYADMGAALRAFHRITFNAFGYVTTEVIDPHPSNAAYMEFQFEKKLREFADLGGDRSIRDDAERAVASSSILFSECGRAVLCHDDLHEGNVLVEERDGSWSVTGVLDVENAVAADPLLDIAKTDYYAVRGNAVKRRGLLEGYGPIPSNAEEIVRLYSLYHAIELWDWFASNGRTEALASIAEDIRALSR
jgi:aminoglycoside phosphotransferase (APT) family kinase protein